jgi:hypothetical protein
MADITVTDPGDVNIADQGFGQGAPVNVNNPSVPASAAAVSVRGDGVSAADNSPGQGARVDVDMNLVAEQSTSAIGPNTVQGSEQPIRSDATVESIQNQVVGQPTSTVPVTTVQGSAGNIRTDSLSNVVVGQNVVNQTYGTGSPTNVNV